MIAIQYITQSSNDQKESPIAVNELNKRSGKEDYVFVVDHGYWHIKSLENIDKLIKDFIIDNEIIVDLKIK